MKKIISTPARTGVAPRHNILWPGIEPPLPRSRSQHQGRNRHLSLPNAQEMPILDVTRIEQMLTIYIITDAVHQGGARRDALLQAALSACATGRFSRGSCNVLADDVKLLVAREVVPRQITEVAEVQH